MRPGNLAELEVFKRVGVFAQTSRHYGVAYFHPNRVYYFAEMVMEYVADGSGTRDIIDTAVTQLIEAINK